MKPKMIYWLLRWIKKFYVSIQNIITRRKEHKTNVPHVTIIESDTEIANNIYLFWWHGVLEEDNLGDYLSTVVVNAIKPQFESKKSEPITLYAIGSLLGFRIQDAVVWGSGILTNREYILAQIRHSHYDVRAVRGPLTRKILLKYGIQCPEVYGDPAVLMPLIYKPSSSNKKHYVSYIAHYSKIQEKLPDDIGNINTINILSRDYKSTIDQIVQSELIVSSSLHGIILAEAYGIPAVLVLGWKDDDFKYRDYYLGTGRQQFVYAKNIREALITKPMPLPNFDSIQRRLLDSFPSDLWEQL